MGTYNDKSKSIADVEKEIEKARLSEEDKIKAVATPNNDNKSMSGSTISGNNDGKPIETSSKTRVTREEIISGKKVINERINNMLENMTEEEKKRTTYGAALVKLDNDSVEMWVSSAGKKGYVPPRIRGNDKVIKNKSLDADSINRHNDAEQTIMREVNEIGAEVISIGATRDMCSACQKVARDNGIIDRVATPLKKIQIRKE